MFFHPDPTVKRHSGFLAPFFTNSTSVGAGFAMPYYWAISNDKDLTFTPKIYIKENEIIIGKGSVQAVDSEGKLIIADKITYEKSREYLLAEGNVKIADIEGNILKTDKSTYDKINEIISTYGNTELILKEGYNLVSKNILYNIKERILSSKENSVFSDNDGNVIETSMFQYHVENNLFSSIGKIKIIDIKKNKYFFKELHVDTKKKEMIGSDVSVVLDQKNFGVSEESDPRFVANNIFMTKDKLTYQKEFLLFVKKEMESVPHGP